MFDVRKKHSLRHGVKAGLGLALALGFVVLGGQSLAVPAASAADIPPSTVTEPFSAPQCADVSGVIKPTLWGNVVAEPGVDVVTDSGGVVRDVTQVFGARLDSYNAGNVVPLYDATGQANHGAYPPLCGVRYDADAGGPVSEWMFCTDRKSAVCGDLDGFGNTKSEDGDVLLPMEQFDINPKLTDRKDDQRIIAYLIQNGFDNYLGVDDGVGQSYDYLPGGGRAAADLSLESRWALQTIIWCVSDPDSAGSGDTNFAPTCAQNMTVERRAEILAKIPADPTLTLTFTEGTQTVALSETAHFTLETNLYNLPITVTATPAGAVALCPGSAGVLTGNKLVVTVNPAVTTTVDLCLTADTAADYTLGASASPPSTSHIEWNQNKHAATTTHPCQVYANFNSVQPFVQTSTALVTYALLGTTPGGGGSGGSGGDATKPATLPSTGAEAPGWLVLLALFLPALGGALLVRHVRLG